VKSDLQYALRMMRKSPGVSIVAILSLALGIGANTAIFTLVDAVLLKMLPVKDPQGLYLVTNVSSYPDYAALRDQNRALEGLIAYSSVQPFGFALQNSSDPRAEVAYATFVSGNYFKVLGVDTVVGRAINEQDDRAAGGGPYIVLSHSFWRKQFGADHRVISSGVRINGYPFTIIGVAHPGFTGIEVGVAPDFYLPVTMRTEVSGNPNWQTRYQQWLRVMARPKPATTIAQAETELSVLNKEQEEKERRSLGTEARVNPGRSVRLQPGAHGYSFIRNRLSEPLMVLMAVVAIVLLIACANLANLLLARAAGRKHEIAVRLAMGATRRRLAAQLLTEAGLMGILGGAAGLVFAVFGAKALIGMVPGPGGVTVRLDTTPDWRILAFTLGVSLLTAIVFGLAPAIQATRPQLFPALKEEKGSTGSRGKFRLRRGLVVAQVALSLLLLIGAGLFVRSLQNLKTLDAGFRAGNVLVVDFDPSRNGYKGQRLRDYYEGLRRRVETLPGVNTVALARLTPLSGSRSNRNFSVPGYEPKSGERMVVDVNAVGPRFFETLGIPIVLGRDFSEQDNPAYSRDPEPFRPGAPMPDDEPGPRVSVVNESMARKYFGIQNPIGMRFSLTERYDAQRSYEIVGVVKDARYFGLRDNTEPMAYLAAWRPGASSMTLCIRTNADADTIIEAARREAMGIDGAVPMLRARTMEQQVDNNVLQEKLVATLSGFFGVLALVLASIGLYGLIAHTATGRSKEIGIRMALGAERRAVLWLILKDALVLVLAGTIVGIPVALGLTKYVSSLLYGITPRDPLSTAAAVAVLMAIATFASYLPARRASRVDPNVVLRYE
jgi:predicted permease